MERTATGFFDWRTRRHLLVIARRVLSYLLVTLMALLFASPFIWMVSMSLQNPMQLAEYPPKWFPRPFAWSNYPEAMSYPYRPFHIFFKNSLLYTVIATAGTAISSAAVAYSFARLSFPGRDALFILVLSTMMLPAQVTLIPQYIVFNKLGWVDSLKPLTIPAWLGSAFNIFLMRQFYMTIPRELDEAAILDGCNYITIFWRVLLPLAKPALVTVVAFSIVRTWNDFMGPLIYLNSNKNLTVSVGLDQFRRASGEAGGFVNVGHIMAASVTALLPMMILFLAAQRYFVTGIAMTGLKEG
jgi:ABC-type glycerol-3-phosphate transport system permease component